MQLGHLPVALSIATYDWNPKTAVFCIAMHWLPNVDSLISKAGLADENFHCTVTHSITFAVAVSAAIAIFSPHYAIFALIAILAHYAADIGSTVGLPLLWPFTKRKFTLALFQDTGWWGKDMLIGYYRQPMSWVLEGSVTLFFLFRLYQIYG
ncbi:MAG: hypothetical protein D6814_01315 [Calditrichaeota bacterium]|nr:MAG: hypothetical protein D6814_01315 [Calditrichota bacterium]